MNFAGLAFAMCAVAWMAYRAKDEHDRAPTARGVYAGYVVRAGAMDNPGAVQALRLLESFDTLAAGGTDADVYTMAWLLDRAAGYAHDAVVRAGDALSDGAAARGLEAGRVAMLDYGHAAIRRAAAAAAI